MNPATLLKAASPAKVTVLYGGCLPVEEFVVSHLETLQASLSTVRMDYSELGSLNPQDRMLYVVRGVPDEVEDLGNLPQRSFAGLVLVCPGEAEGWLEFISQRRQKRYRAVDCGPLSKAQAEAIGYAVGMGPENAVWLGSWYEDSARVLEAVYLWTLTGVPVSQILGPAPKGAPGWIGSLEPDRAVVDLAGLALLSKLIRTPDPFESLAKRVGWPLWKVAQAADLARSYSPDELMRRADYAVECEALAAVGAPYLPILRQVCDVQPRPSRLKRRRVGAAARR